MKLRVGLFLCVLACVLGYMTWWRASGQRASRPLTDEADAAPRERVSKTFSSSRASTLHLSEGHASAAPAASADFVLEGQVLSAATGRGVPQAIVVLAAASSVSEAKTDADGRFAWTTSVAGRHQLSSITATGFVSFAPELGHSPIVIHARPGVRLSGVTFYLSPGADPVVRTVKADGPLGTISGRVVDPQGQGIGGALVSAGRDEVEHRAQSDDDGRFVLVDLKPDPLLVRATHPDWAASEIREVAPGLPELEIQLRPGGSVSGRVVDKERGTPIAAFTVVARARLGAIQRGEQKSLSFFDEDGRYQLSGLGVGTQCLSVLAAGRSASSEQCVTVAPRGEAHADFELSRGAKLSGRVLDRASHAALAGARVALESSFELDPSLPFPVVYSTETDAEGRFELAGLDTGTRSIFVTANGHHSRVIPGVRLDADRPPAPLEIDLLATESGEEPSIESAGINVALHVEGDVLVIDDVTVGGGGAQAGLLRGDVLLRVDGLELASLGLQAGVEHLRGPEGSTVTVTMRRPPDSAQRDVVVTRRRVLNR